MPRSKHTCTCYPEDESLSLPPPPPWAAMWTDWCNQTKSLKLLCVVFWCPQDVTVSVGGPHRVFVATWVWKATCHHFGVFLYEYPQAQKFYTAPYWSMFMEVETFFQFFFPCLITYSRRQPERLSPWPKPTVSSQN